MKVKLSNLPLEQQEEIIGKYYGNVKLADIISEHNLIHSPNQLIWNFPWEELDENCSNCNAKLYRERASRSPHTQKTIYKFCSNCGHTDELYCHCKNCKKIRLEEKVEHSEKVLIENLLNIKKDKINFEELTLIDKIILGAMLREGISDDLKTIKPIRRFNNTLVPTVEFCSEIITRLLAINAIVINPKTNSKFIEIIDNSNYEYYIFKVKWSLNLESDNLSKVELIESIIKSKVFDDSQYVDALQLWKKIALYESIEYYIFSIKKYLGIDYEIGYKTKMVLSDFTNYFSVAQIYGFINKAVMKGVVLRAGGKLSKKRTVNTITGYLENYGERSKLKKGGLKKHQRAKECPESALSKFFFERIIKIGNDGFSEVPNIEKIQNKLSESEVE